MDVDFKIVRTHNSDVVRRILTVPALYDVVMDDTAPAPEDYEPFMHETIYHLLAVRGNKVLALFVIHPMNNTVAVMHANVLPKFWGEREQNAAIGKAVIQWVWDNTEFHKIVATVPVIYKKVLGYAQRIGMQREGIMRKSYMKDGELHDQYHLGVNR